MGQKIHPVGFRNGITKGYNSTWFASYTDYAALLEEDYCIRYVLACFFKALPIHTRHNARGRQRQSTRYYNHRSVFEAAGITKFEVRRKGRLLELLIYSGYPKVLSSLPGWYNRLIENHLTFIRYANKVSIKVMKVKNSDCESSIVAGCICDQLEKRVAFRKILRSVSQDLSKAKVQGFRVKLSGRLGGAEMARSESICEGRVPLQTLDADISYSFREALTKYGIIGVKVWICYGVSEKKIFN
jgi:small subunit ribosomal protein S3